MTIYERASECFPENTWDEIVKQWKKHYPNPNEYVRLKGGDSIATQEWASELHSRNIPFTWINSIPFLSALGFGVYNDSEDTSDLDVDDIDKSPEITFISLPKEFAVRSLSTINRIEYYNGMIYYIGVPIAVLEKMNEVGKLFTK